MRVHDSETTLDEIHVSSGGSPGASNKKQAVSSPPQVATPPRSSEPPVVPLELEFLVRGDRDKRISSDERARRRQIQDDIDWLGKWLLEYAYHQIKKDQGLYPEGPVEIADDLVASSFWWREAIGTISKEDVMEQFRVLETQLHEAPDKVFVQAIFGWTSYQMWKDGRDIQVIKGQAGIWSHVQGVDIEDEYWQMLRQGFLQPRNFSPALRDVYPTERSKAGSGVEQQGISSLSQHALGASTRQHLMLNRIDPSNQ
ncbi:hypothetical protein K4K59_002154 [Colletotrichum sp. SAR11_240]|nr:hypothetical protein K4K59_002154 [Colletotrichum sp. SAR11_240]